MALPEVQGVGHVPRVAVLFILILQQLIIAQLTARQLFILPLEVVLVASRHAQEGVALERALHAEV